MRHDQDLVHVGGGELRGDGVDVRPRDGHLDGPIDLLRRRDDFPGRAVERAFSLLRNDENHLMLSALRARLSTHR